jgi:cardiolipin synthase
VVDGQRAVTGSQNLTEPSYHSDKHRAAGRRWVELTVTVTGPLARALGGVFTMDWYTETGELLAEPPGAGARPEPLASNSAVAGAGQVVPSGPGVVAENNLRLFTALVYGATRRISLTSPYFVPDESLLYAVTTAAQRGVEVELFVGAEGDQLMVHKAQCSYYRALLEAGVRIWLFEAPLVLHAKHFTVDDDVAVIGSSNMDLRSFALNYEVSLLLTGAELVRGVREVEDGYRARSHELTLEEWSARSRWARYGENVFRLTSALQ